MESQNKFVIGVLLLISSHLQAGVLDRSGQPLNILATDTNTVSYKQIKVNPSVSGTDSLGGSTGDVSKAFTLQQLTLHAKLADQWSLAFILDQPWGGDFQYASRSLLYGGTKATLETQALSGIAQFSTSDRVSIYGGIRYDQIDGEIELNGLAYGPFAGYRLSAEKGSSYGYLAGASYAIKPYALRLSLTYFSEMAYRLDTQETLPAFSLSSDTTTSITIPQAINIDFQTGIAPKTLFFSKVRWVDWSEFTFEPEILEANGISVASFDEELISYTLGLSRQLSSSWFGSVAWLYEPKASDANSIFRPSNGYKGIGIAAIYQANEQWQLRANLSVTDVGDASAETDGGNRVEFENNDSKTIGFEANYRF